MSKKCYRFFGGLLTVQKNWLNKMAEKGYRLIRTGKLLYEFEKCKPGQVQYCVEFIGQKSKGFPSFSFSTISNSLLNVVVFVATRPPISAHGRQRTLPTE